MNVPEAKRSRWKRKTWLAALVWSAIIVVLSTMPGINLPETLADLFSWDKLAHAFIYGVQVWLLLRTAEKPTGGQTAIILLVSVLYGASMEAIQYAFFPGRYFELLDIAANTVGSIIGWLIFRWKNK